MNLALYTKPTLGGQYCILTLNPDNTELKKRKAQIKRFEAQERNIKARLDAIQDKINSLVFTAKGLTEFTTIDFELFEFDNSKILEFGVTVVSNEASKTEHYIITDNLKYKNEKFASNERDNFIHGQSKYIPMSELKSTIESYINDNTILVGYGVNLEVKTLNELDIKYKQIIDVATVIKEIKQLKNTPSMKSIIIDILDHEPTNLHNAGNDSFYISQIVKKLSKV